MKMCKTKRDEEGCACWSNQTLKEDFTFLDGDECDFTVGIHHASNAAHDVS